MHSNIETTPVLSLTEPEASNLHYTGGKGATSHGCSPLGFRFRQEFA
jgi:hypothetical protein